MYPPLPPGTHSVARTLAKQETCIENEADAMCQHIREQRFKAADFKTMDGLPKLAREHAANFKQLLGCDRSGKTRSRRHLVPNHEIRFASCGTGAGTELLVFRAIQIAMSEMSRNSADFAFKFCLRNKSI